VPFGLRDDDWRSLLRGLVRGEYHLLLGAGGSVDSHDAEGRHLPTGVGLTRELVEAFDIPTDPNWVSLARAFEAAKQRRSDRGESLSEYLSRRFTGCTPAAWYEYVCTTRWSAIWNLNIDDVLVRAYTAAGDRADQTLTELTWQDLVSRPNPDRDEVQAVFLHGAASRLESSGLEGLVFGIVEYLRAAEQRHAWHKIFADEFQTEPFIVVGARLVDEVDLGEILRRGNRSHDLSARPSLAVLSEIDQLQREEFNDRGRTLSRLLPRRSLIDLPPTFVSTKLSLPRSHRAPGGNCHAMPSASYHSSALYGRGRPAPRPSTTISMQAMSPYGTTFLRTGTPALT
jgi:SIR2-like domain